MSEASERVRGVRELPLFPLPLVLFPGVPLPLHIFEPRYQQMLRDVRVGNNLFGISCVAENSSERPPVGHVGCVAEVVEAQPLADGRANILTLGVMRYRLEAYVEGDAPYLVARVQLFEDEAEDAELLHQRASQVLDLFMRIARAVQTINDDRGTLPELPDAGAERLSFLIAAAIEIETEVKQELLELTLGSERLERLEQLLSQVVDNYEERARMHGLAKSNGHSGREIRF